MDSNLTEQLHKLFTLRQDGLIDENEYKRCKEQLLNAPAASHHSLPQVLSKRARITSSGKNNRTFLYILIGILASASISVTVFFLFSGENMNFFSANGLFTKKEDSPEYVAEAYLKALRDKNWDEAKSLGNEDTKAKIDGIKGFGGDAGILSVRNVDCIVSGNTADCSFCCMKEGNGTLKLVKEYGKWIVNDKKEGQND